MTRYYQPTQLHLGIGFTDKIGEIAAKYGSNVLLITSDDFPLQPLYQRVVSNLDEKNLKTTHFKGVIPNPTIESVAEALKLTEEVSHDVIVVVGGGSAIDTAKAVAFKAVYPDLSWDSIFETYGSPVPEYEPLTGVLPILAIPTTSGTGSHVTQAAVLSIGEDKLTLFHQDLFSREAILDPELTTTLPQRMTAATAFDTFTHAFESYISARATPLTMIDSLDAMNRVIINLPRVLDNPSSVELRTELTIADTLGGRALSNAGAAAPHPLSEIIGGITNAVHGEALACVYPSFIKESTHKYYDKFTVVAKMFNKDASADDLENLIRDFLEVIGLTKTLNDFITNDGQKEAILKHPALDHLPFGDREYFEVILNAS